MAPSILHFTEPHPSVKASKPRVLGSGRGGAGNYARYTPNELTSGPSATGPAARASSLSSTSSTSAPVRPKSSHYSTGIGGFGNVKPSSEKRIFSFDEELERQHRLSESVNSSPVYHVGRGGAGNAFSDRDVSASKARQTSAGSVSSVGSEGSGKARRSVEGLKGRVARVFARE